jgi:RHS repeat-associated protein
MSQRPPTGGPPNRIEPGTAVRGPAPAPAPIDAPGRTKDLLQVAPKLELPRGGGAIKGIGETFKANPVTGSASVTVPLTISSGRGGLTPALTLSYDSGSGNGPFGIGWSLSQAMIQRKTDKGLPTYTDNDVFVLSESEDLVPVGAPRTVMGDDEISESPVDYTVQTYMPRVEAAHAKIERWKDPTGRAHWRTWSAKNVRRLYGTVTPSRLVNPFVGTKVYCWYLDEERDLETGNIIVYDYDLQTSDAASGIMADLRRTPVCRYLKRVRYGNKVPFSVDDGFYFELVFDYGDHTADPPTPEPDLEAVPQRQDPFSRFRPGFDHRCTRLCRRVLMFHRFGAEEDPPVLTKYTSFAYDENPVASQLVSVTHTGRDPAGAELSMPPLAFTYVAPSPASAPAFVAGMEDMPGGIDFSHSQWVDLDGEGLTGLLTEGGSGWWYKRNEGEAKLAWARRLPTRPMPSVGSGQFVDADGDGRMEFLVKQPGVAGTYTRTMDDGWEGFRSFKGVPTVEGRSIDLDGDGLPDVLVASASGLTWYKSEGLDGWSLGGQAERPRDENSGPVALYQTDTDSVFLADMTGDGLLDVVRVQNGNICYWPNLGFARFGRRVQMSGSPFFERAERYDPKRVRFADIDGSGPSDLVYIGPEGVRWWPNQAGNGFGTEATIRVPVSNSIMISFADLRGDGTSCLVWSSPLGRDRLAPLRYVRLMQDGKPYLMKTITNNLGRTTTLTYTPSTAFYLADRRAGTPWATRLSFPVQCLSQVEVVDGVTNWRSVSTYTYHHGYFDPREREFRGFGRVDQRDAESLDGTEHAQPPVVTRSWFHTGAWKELGRQVAAYTNEWCASLLAPSGNAMPTGLTAALVREAHRALKGKPLRVEVYAEDGADNADKPYLVTTNTWSVVAVTDAPRVFRVDARETVTEHVERGTDARVSHELVLAVGPHGEVTRQATVSYGKAAGDLPQTTPVVTVKTASFVHDEDDDKRWHIGVPTRETTWHLGSEAPTLGSPATIAGLNTAFTGATAIDWDEAVPGSGGWARLVADTRISYADDLAAEVFPTDWTLLGERAFVYQTYQRAFSDAQLTSADAFDSLVDGTNLGAAGYVAFTTPETGWWAPSGTLTRDTDHFYLPIAYVDPFANETTVAYDAAFLAPSTVTDALGNETAITYDTHFLAPSSITDPNGNGAEVDFDPLGRVVAIAVFGADGEGDTLESPTETYEYDLDAWWNPDMGEDPGPASVLSRKRETHDVAVGSTRWLERTDFTDGAGNVVHSKEKCAPDPVTDDPRWIGTGHIVLDNKGNVVKQYEPFFAANADYEFETEAASAGVASTVLYDPLGRAIQVDLPNGTRRRVSFTPWGTTTWDENDCSADGDLDGDPALLARAAAHVDTPAEVLFDAQGRPYKTREMLLVAVDPVPAVLATTTLTLDVAGNPLVVTDAIAVDTQTQAFDQLGRPIRTDGPDAGFTVALLDVAGQPVQVFRAGSLSTEHTYDMLRRRTHLTITDGIGTRVVERNLYGETEGVPGTGYFKGRLYRQYDSAGVVTNTAFDFKGNLLGQERRFWGDIDDLVDWATLVSTEVGDIEGEAETLLGADTHTTAATFDALNRRVTETDPDGSIRRFGFDDGGKLLTEGVDIRGGSTTDIIVEIEYNARGQRVAIEYGNGVTRAYTYDPLSFRLTTLVSVRASDEVQNLTYTYDPVGNITEVANDAEDTIFFDNEAVTPNSAFTYDALYRLTSGDGRERASAAQPVGENEYFVDYSGSSVPVDTAVARYAEAYTYDLVGNLLELKHHESSLEGTVLWKRIYVYDGQTEDDPPTGSKTSNRLVKTSVGASWYDYSYDDRGNMVEMPHLDSLEYDFRDQLRRSVLPGGTDDAIYFYDAAGKRVRKVVRRGANVEERVYVGGWELWTKSNGSGLQEARETVHAMDGDKRIALIETKTWEGGTDLSTTTGVVTVIRYQLDNHLASASLELDDTGALISYEEYHPYGSTAWWAQDSAIDVSLKRYRYTGMERDEETGLQAHGVRMYVSWLGRWSTADPSGMKGGINRYEYANGSPLTSSDTSGLASPFGPRSASVDGLAEAIERSLPPDARAALFAITEGFDVAYEIGKPDNSLNISSTVSRFSHGIGLREAPRGEPKGTPELGSQVNAFRHTFLQAVITERFGARIAEKAGYAHEENPFAIAGSRRDVYQFDTLQEADASIDARNNEIGRWLGATSGAHTNKDLATAVLNFYHKEGLWVAERTESGKWRVVRQKLDDKDEPGATKQFARAVNDVNGLDDYGFTPEKRAKFDRAQEARAASSALIESGLR